MVEVIPIFQSSIRLPFSQLVHIPIKYKVFPFLLIIRYQLVLQVAPVIKGKKKQRLIFLTGWRKSFPSPTPTVHKTNKKFSNLLHTEILTGSSQFKVFLLTQKPIFIPKVVLSYSSFQSADTDTFFYSLCELCLVRKNHVKHFSVFSALKIEKIKRINFVCKIFTYPVKYLLIQYENARNMCDVFKNLCFCFFLTIKIT